MIFILPVCVVTVTCALPMLSTYRERCANEYRVMVDTQGVFHKSLPIAEDVI